MPAESGDVPVLGDNASHSRQAPDQELAAALAERDRLRAALAQQTIEMNVVLDERLGGWWTWSVAQATGEFSPGIRTRLGLGDAPLSASDLAMSQTVIEGWLAEDDTTRLDAYVELTHRDGHGLHYQMRGAVIERTADGRPAKILGGYVDLAHEVRVEHTATALVAEKTHEFATLNAALEKQAEQLTRSNAALEDFAYAASHDLQTPLRAIAHFATWIDEDLPKDSGQQVREHVARLLDRVERLGQLHRDLLAYARVNHTPVRWIVEDIALFVRAIWNRIRRPGFELEVLGELGEVQVPEPQLRAVLAEALNNATRHHDGPTGRVQVRLSREDDVLHIEIEDDGPGIEPRYAEQAFKVLETLRPRDAGAGSGMGLPIARRHARRVGGDLTLLERDGRGARFVLRCPVRAA